MIINDINIVETLGLRVKDYQIEAPTTKNPNINVPLAHGGIISNPLNMVLFENREIVVELDKKLTHAGEAYTTFSKLGQVLYSSTRYPIVFSWDKNFFWIGRCVGVDIERILDKYVTYQIRFEVEPYKYDVQIAGEPWLWNPFNFLNGIIASTPTKIKGKGNVVVFNRTKPTNPFIQVTHWCTVQFEETVYVVEPGTFFDPGIVLKPGKNTFLVDTHDKETTITIKYRMGEL